MPFFCTHISIFYFFFITLPLPSAFSTLCRQLEAWDLGAYYFVILSTALYVCPSSLQQIKCWFSPFFGQGKSSWFHNETSPPEKQVAKHVCRLSMLMIPVSSSLLVAYRRKQNSICILSMMQWSKLSFTGSCRLPQKRPNTPRLSSLKPEGLAYFFLQNSNSCKFFSIRVRSSLDTPNSTEVPGKYLTLKVTDPLFMAEQMCS